MSNVKCKDGFNLVPGNKQIKFANKTKYTETLSVNLISATWDHTQNQWRPGETYTVSLTAEAGETVYGDINYEGCGKGRSYAAAYQIGITGQKDWLYTMKHNDPYYPEELGNSNNTINIVSKEYDKYSASFSNS